MLTASRLTALRDRVADDPHLQFELLLQIGRAADLSHNPSPPFYAHDSVALLVVNQAWWEAATLAVADPSLLDGCDAASCSFVRGYADLQRSRPRP
jgi:hypothetical protein